MEMFPNWNRLEPRGVIQPNGVAKEATGHQTWEPWEPASDKRHQTAGRRVKVRRLGVNDSDGSC